MECDDPEGGWNERCDECRRQHCICDADEFRLCPCGSGTYEYDCDACEPDDDGAAYFEWFRPWSRGRGSRNARRRAAATRLRQLARRAKKRAGLWWKTPCSHGCGETNAYCACPVPF